MSGETDTSRFLNTQINTVDTETLENQIDWKAYADKYDLMATNNPSYEENVHIALDQIRKRKLPRKANICDLGAGTGNYILALNSILPEASYTHLDYDHKMCGIASDKYNKAELTNVEIVEEYVQRATLKVSHYDLIICVNSLYAMKPVELTLRRIKSWLKPSGSLFVIDFGAQNNVLDWGWYIFREISRKKGPFTALRTFVEGSEVIRQNQIGSRSQATGEYWTHSEQSFRDKLIECGFTIVDQSKCYRGYCDLAMCEPVDESDSSRSEPKRLSS